MYFHLVHYIYSPMLTSFHLRLYMFHYLLHRNSLCYMFHYFTLSSHTCYTPYNYALSRSYNPNFTPHLYIIDNMFMLMLSSYSIMHLILNYLDLLPLSLSSNLLMLASSFTNSMLLPLLNLYILMSLSDFTSSNYLYYSMSLLVLTYLYNLLLSSSTLLMLPS